MAFTCPTGAPPAVCAILEPASQGNTWNPIDVYGTFQTWYAESVSQSGGNPVPPADPQLYLPGTWANGILKSAADYWTNIGFRNPSVLGSVDPKVWGFPWQYTPPTATSTIDIIQKTMANLLQNPANIAMIAKGEWPPFDPTKLDWGDAISTPLWDPNTWPQEAPKVVGASDALLQRFAARGAQCGLFQQSADVIARAWNAFIAYGENASDPRADPCTYVQAPAPQPGPGPGPAPTPAPPLPAPGPTLPVPAPAPTTPVAKETSYAPYVLGALGLGTAGVLVYVLMTQKSGGALGMARENRKKYQR